MTQQHCAGGLALQRSEVHRAAAVIPQDEADSAVAECAPSVIQQKQFRSAPDQLQELSARLVGQKGSPSCRLGPGPSNWGPPPHAPKPATAGFVSDALKVPPNKPLPKNLGSRCATSRTS